MTQNIILNHQEIEHKIRRIAYQIYETFVEEKEIVLAGISKNGFVFAQKLAIYIETISDIKVTLCEVTMDKENPFATVSTTLPLESIENKGLILVDDVLN